MLFTGKAVKQLGAESPFAVEGTPQAAASAIPTTAFGGEEELQRQTRIAASSSALRYQKSLKDLQQQAESTLGSTASSGLIPGTSQIGGITGSLVNQEKQAQGSALTSLYNQSQQNVAAQKPEKLFNE
jgi:predicted alpha/beta-hydrolase family hydrolase